MGIIGLGGGIIVGGIEELVSTAGNSGFEGSSDTKAGIGAGCSSFDSGTGSAWVSSGTSVLATTSSTGGSTCSSLVDRSEGFSAFSSASPGSSSLLSCPSAVSPGAFSSGLASCWLPVVAWSCCCCAGRSCCGP